MCKTVRIVHIMFLTSDVSAAIRLEWCKSRARAMRWTEEISLLAEEWYRALRFFEFVARVWDKRTQQTFDDDSPNSAGVNGSEKPLGEQESVMVTPEVTEGRVSYAKRQAGIFRSMGARCSDAWADIDGYIAGFGSTFDDNYEGGSGIVEDMSAFSLHLPASAP
jgi:hypothetical protein